MSWLDRIPLDVLTQAYYDRLSPRERRRLDRYLLEQGIINPPVATAPAPDYPAGRFSPHR